MGYTKGKWKAYCLGSEGYQIRLDNEGMPATKVKEELRERLTPIVERMGGSFETQKANAHLIAAAPDLYETLNSITEKLGKRIEDDGSNNYHPLEDEDDKLLGEIYTQLCVVLAKAEGK